VSTILKERAKKEKIKARHNGYSKETLQTESSGKMITEKFEEDDNPINSTDKRNRLGQHTKDIIQLMMEGLEKDNERSDNFVRMIKKGQDPIGPTIEKKAKERFLKNTGDLAKSTYLLSVKRDASKKIWDFSELVKVSAKMGAAKTKVGKVRNTLLSHDSSLSKAE